MNTTTPNQDDATQAMRHARHEALRQRWARYLADGSALERLPTPSWLAERVG